MQESILNSKDRKIQLLKQFHNDIEQFDDDKLINEIDYGICKELNNLIEEDQTAFQQEILNIILIISEKGSKMVKQYEMNKFYWTFEESGLLRKIEQIFLQQIEIQKETQISIQYNELFSNLVLIISFIIKYKRIDRDILVGCGKYFKFQINNLIQVLRNQINQKDLDQQQEEQRIQQIEIELRKGARMNNSISRIVENQDNRKYLVEQLKIHEDIAPLLHIRCPDELNCSQCLNLPESESSNQLLSSVYFSLEELSWYENDVRQFLLDHHNIFNHLTPLIILFSTNNSHQINKSNQFQQNSNSTYPESTLLLIAESLLLLCSLLDENTSLCLIAYYTPDLIQSLIDLTRFERKQHQSQRTEKQNVRIRIQSNNCLGQINCYGDEIVKERILNEYKNMKIQTDIIGLGGGSEEQNDVVIGQGLINIEDFFYINREGNDNIYHGKPQLIKTVNEQIKDEGGLEEIEANLFHKKQLDQDDVQYKAYETKEFINNIKKDDSNQ